MDDINEFKASTLPAFDLSEIQKPAVLFDALKKINLGLVMLILEKRPVDLSEADCFESVNLSTTTQRQCHRYESFGSGVKSAPVCYLFEDIDEWKGGDFITAKRILEVSLMFNIFIIHDLLDYCI